MSCVDAIAAITEFIRTGIDKKAQGQVCFIDSQKAFDTLDHDILLKRSLDLEGKFLKFGKSIFQTVGSTSVIRCLHGNAQNSVWCSPGLRLGSIFVSFVY